MLLQVFDITPPSLQEDGGGGGVNYFPGIPGLPHWAETEFGETKMKNQ